MRISDWSSDVCSSDLLQRQKPVDEVDRAGTDGAADRAGIALDRVVEAVEGIGDRADDLLATGMPEPALIEGDGGRPPAIVRPLALGPIARGGDAAQRLHDRDRKSTRLNSSH